MAPRQQLRPQQRRHFNRSLFLLTEYQALLKGMFSFECEDGSCWNWPMRPCFNKPTSARSNASVKRKEADLERFLFRGGAPLTAFKESIAPIVGFERQLPIGLFESPKRARNAVSPGKGEQIDLWAISPDSRTFHMFELKVGKNIKVGSIAETAYYALMLSYVQRGIRGQAISIDRESVGLRAAQTANRIVAWLVAPDYHPLVHSYVGGVADSPLALLNKRLLSRNVQFRILPFDDQRQRNGTFAWRVDELWPRAYSVAAAGS